MKLRIVLESRNPSYGDANKMGNATLGWPKADHLTVGACCCTLLSRRLM